MGEEVDPKEQAIKDLEYALMMLTFTYQALAERPPKILDLEVHQRSLTWLKSLYESTNAQLTKAKAPEVQLDQAKN